MPLVDLGIAQVNVRPRTLAQRLDCNRMIRRWAGDQPANLDEDDVRAHRVNFITFSSYSEMTLKREGYTEFRLPRPEMSDAEFGAAFTLYLEITEDCYVAWNRAVTEIVIPRDKTAAPPEALTDQEKNNPE